MSLEAQETAKKIGVVAIIGRPSVGKSTFINTACGGPVSIVSPIPQTTRNAIKGILNTNLGQLVFIDTPGLHKSEKTFNTRLALVSKSALEGADCVLYILDATRPPALEEDEIVELLKESKLPVVIAVNKCDLGTIIEPFDSIKERLGAQLFLMSAKKDKGVEEILKALYDLSPIGAPLYGDVYTDQDIAFRVSEVVRGEAIKRLRDEIPHAIYVNVADCERRGTKLWVRSFLCVESESQKAIVIGRDAKMIKSIRIASIKALKDILEQKIELDLQVKVDKGWRTNNRVLDKISPTKGL